MRARITFAFALATIVGGAQADTVAVDVDSLYVTGAAPIGKAAYAALPKLKRHRAWLPKKVDLTSLFPEPGAQGAQQDCTAWASTYAARSYLTGTALGHRLDPLEALSPAYVYNRLRPAGTPCWGTMQLVDVLNLLKTEGTVPMAEFPDNMLKCKEPASPDLRPRAATFRIDDWRAVDREVPNDWRTPLILDDVKGSLARGVPVVFAMPVDHAFKALKPGETYRSAAPQGHDWHAMALIGYDEDRQAFRLINSWGKNWADGGYTWIDYTTFRALAGEAYALEASFAKSARPMRTAREEMEADLAGFQCGNVQQSTVDGHPVLTGFGGVKTSLDTLRAAALAASPDTRFQVAYHPWPQCEAETTLTQALHAGGVTLDVQSDSGGARPGDPVAMHGGEKFGIAASTTADRPWLSIVYLQADGSAVQLYSGQPGAAPNGARTVVLGTSGPTATRFEVAPPFGNEILIALASKEPLFGDQLNGAATERQFLTGLRARLLAVPQGNVSAAVVRLNTAG